MNTGNDFSVFPVLSGILLQGVNVWGIIGNILIIKIVANTPGLKGFTGALLINQAIGDIISEIFNISVYIDFLVEGENFNLKIFLRLGIFAANGVVGHTLSALSVSLYFAIRRPHEFKNFFTSTQVYFLLFLSWLINIAIVSLYLSVQDIYVMEPTGDLVMNVTLEHVWFIALLITNVIIFPFCSALTCFIRILNFTRLPSIATVGAKHVKKMKLSQTIHITTMVFLLTYTPLIAVLSLGVKIRGARATAAIVHYSYHACKPFIYLKCYQPFRGTCKEMCCLTNRVKPQVRLQTKPASQQNISALQLGETTL